MDDGKTWVDYNDTSRVFDKTGVYNVIARSVGANGKCSDTTPVYVIKIDKDKPAPPILSANVSNGASSRDNVRITIKGGETPSGIKNYQYKLTRDDDWQDEDDDDGYGRWSFSCTSILNYHLTTFSRVDVKSKYLTHGMYVINGEHTFNGTEARTEFEGIEN